MSNKKGVEKSWPRIHRGMTLLEPHNQLHKPYLAFIAHQAILLSHLCVLASAWTEILVFLIPINKPIIIRLKELRKGKIEKIES